MKILLAKELVGLPVWAIVAQLSYLNKQYRIGKPEVTDYQYDMMRKVLVDIDPYNPFILSVEPEYQVDGKGRVSHEKHMLSTDKAYTSDEVGKWLEKVIAYARENGHDEIKVRLTPKLDGCAGSYLPDAKAKFVTRGDGEFGNDFTSLGEQCAFVGDQGVRSVGELICDENYYQDVLKAQGVKHPRSFISGLLGSDDISDVGKKALSDGAVHFVSYANMTGMRVYTVDEFKAILTDLESVEVEVTSECQYRTDGVVIQAHSDDLFAEMGNNGSFHYAQIAKKIAGEPLETVCKDIVYQTGRTGRQTPVLMLEPLDFDGSTVSKATAHHAGNVKHLGLGKGAVVTIIKSGEIIPKIISVLKKSDNPIVPDVCSCCESTLVWVNNFLECQNTECNGRVAAHLRFFTKKLGMDLIGFKASEKLANEGYNAVKLLSITVGELERIGFGAGQSANIIAELARVKPFPVEDYKILASVGIRMLGDRASKELLKDTPLSELSSITREKIIATDGFAEKKADAILSGVSKYSELLDALSSFFTEIKSSKVEVTESSITGLRFVFTGKMLQGNRDDMSANAEQLGAIVQSSVNSKTDYLIAGQKVGVSKMAKAEKNGVKVLSEQDYLDMIN